MKRLRSVMLCAIVLAGVAAVNSASASAACTPSAKSAYLYCVEGNYLAAGEAVKGSLGPSTFVAKVTGGTVEIECKKGSLIDSPQVEGGGKSKGGFKFEECKIKNFVGKCSVATTLETKELTDQLINVPPARIEDEFKPVSGSFIVITISTVSGQTCAIAQTFEVTGSQPCEVDKTNAEAEAEALSHKIFCKPSSKLKVGANEAKFTGEGTIENVSGKKGSVKPN